MSCSPRRRRPSNCPVIDPMTPTLFSRFQAVPFHGPDRRRRSLQAAFQSWIVGTVHKLDLYTAETMLTYFVVLLAAGMIALGSRILAVPPPLMHGYVPTLPAPVWSILLLIGVSWQLRHRDGPCFFCTRRNGAAFTLFVMAALVPSLFLVGPGMACMVAGAWCWQLLLVAKLFDSCRNAAK